MASLPRRWRGSTCVCARTTGRPLGRVSHSLQHPPPTTSHHESCLVCFLKRSPRQQRGEGKGGRPPTPLSRGELRSSQSSHPAAPSHYRLPGALFGMKAFKNPCVWMVMHSFLFISLILTEPGARNVPWTLISRSSGAGGGEDA